MIDANIRLLLETCVSAFRACVSPSPPQAAFSSAKLRSSLEGTLVFGSNGRVVVFADVSTDMCAACRITNTDDASVDEIVAKISIPESMWERPQSEFF